MAQDGNTSLEFLKSLTVCERELGLPSGFLRELAAEDDWSFIIKVHGLLEAVVSDVLAAVVDPRLREVFSRLELSATGTGKLVFAEVLGVVGPGEKRFVRKLSELRNDLVHDIRRVSFRFSTYVEGFDANRRKAFQESVLYFAESDASFERLKAYVLEDPKTAIWIATMNFVGRCVTQSIHAKAMNALRDLAERPPDPPAAGSKAEQS